jgi:hypothetical protein
MLAGEETAGITSWLNVTSALAGSQAPGVNDTIRITMDSHYAMRGDQIANIVFTSNDPTKKVTKIPVSLHVNGAPTFMYEAEPIIMMSENEIRTITIGVSDAEGNSFTIQPAGTYADATHTFTNGTLSITLSPEYGDAGMYTYTYQATDEYGATSEVTLSVQVIHTNRAPEFIGESRSMNFTATGMLSEFAIEDYFSDPDNDAFTFTLSNENAVSAEVFSSDNKFLIKPVAIGESKIAFTLTDSYGAITKDTITVVVEVVLGAEEDMMNNGLGTYPNPATDATTVTLTNDWTGEVNLIILDAMGRQYATHQMHAGVRESKLDVSKLSKGIYIIRAVSNTRQGNIKFIKK